MTRNEILNTPEIVDFMIDKSVMVDSKMKLHKRLDELCKLALKALEQEPCEDCISRQAVLEQINCWIGSGEYRYTNATYYLTERVKHISSVNPQKSDWIPVSERLPKIAGVYRVTRYFPNNRIIPNYLVDACFFDGSNTWYNDNRINHERAYADNVIAWQENPEPYKAESEDKE